MPTYVQSAAALAALTERGYITPAERVDRKKLGADVARIFQTDHVVIDPQYVADRAVTLAELCVKALGLDDPDLRLIMAQLTAPGEGSQVQRALENGYVLTSAPVKRQIIGPDGTPTEQTYAGRFITSHVDLLTEHYLAPQINRLERSAKTLKANTDMAIRRVPALAPVAERLLAAGGEKASRALLGQGDAA